MAYTFERNTSPPDRAQATTLSGFRRDVSQCERWRVFEDGEHVFDLWLANGFGNLLRAGSTGLARPCIKRGEWDVRGSDPSARLERQAAALGRAWAQRDS